MRATSIAVVELPKISARAARLEVIDLWPYYGPQCQERLHKGIKIGGDLEGHTALDQRPFVMVQSGTAKNKRMKKRRKAGGGYTS